MFAPAAIVSKIWGQQGPADSPLSDQQVVELETEQWAVQWAEHRLYSNGIIDADCQAAQQLVVDEVRNAAMTFPVHTGLGADNFVPRAVARLSDIVIAWLCVLLYAADCSTISL